MGDQGNGFGMSGVAEFGQSDGNMDSHSNTVSKRKKRGKSRKSLLQDAEFNAIEGGDQDQIDYQVAKTAQEERKYKHESFPPDADLDRNRERTPSDASITKTLSKLTRIKSHKSGLEAGNSIKKKLKNRRRKGRSRAGTHSSHASGISLASGRNYGEVGMFLSTANEEENEKAKKRLTRTISRISLPLSAIEDDSDEIDHGTGKHKSRHVSGVDLDQLNETGSQHGEQYIAIDASQIAAYVNAAEQINSDPSRKVAIDIEFVNPVTAQIQSRAMNPAQAQKASKKGISVKKFKHKSRKPVFETREASRRKKHQKKNGSGGFCDCPCCVWCLCVATLALVVFVILVAVFFGEIEAFFKKTENNDDNNTDVNHTAKVIVSQIEVTGAATTRYLRQNADDLSLS